jgi:MFS family permease
MSTAIQTRVLRVLFTSQILVGVGFAGTVAAGSLLVTEITGSETLAGLTQTSGVLGAALMALPLAALTQRGGRRRAVSTGYLIGALGAAIAIVGGASRTVWLMLLGALFVGAAQASGFQARFAATDLAPADHRARHLSIVVWGATVGGVVGPNLMAPSATAARWFGLPDLTGPYLIALVALAASGAVVLIFLRPDPYLTAHQAQAIAAKDRPSTRQTMRALRNMPLAKFALAAIAMGHVAMVSIMVMTPVHMKHVDVSLTIIGIVISVHVAGMYAFSPVMGWLADKFGRVRTIQLGVVVLLLSAVISGFAAADDAQMLGIGLFLLGLGWSATLVAGSTLLSETVPLPMRAGAQGTSDLIMSLSAAAGGAIAGVVIAYLGYGWLCFLGVTPIAIVGVISVGVERASSSASDPLAMEGSSHPQP